MAVTREDPVSKNGAPFDVEDDEDLDFREPITKKPKQTKRETLLQHKREKGALGAMQALAFGAGMLGRFTPLPILPEDIAAVHLHARPIAKAMSDAAEEDERWAEIFDRLTDMGPYSMIIEAIAPLVIQIYVNHKREIRNDPVLAAQMGAVPPDALLTAVYGNQETEFSENGDGTTE